MKLEYRYAARSDAVTTDADARIGLATNLLRGGTFFRGDVERPLVLREGLGALWDVVTSDLRYRPKDRVAFRAWLEEQDRAFLAGLGARSADAKTRMVAMQARLAELDVAREKRRASFERARRAWIAFAIEDAAELALVLDPVVTVHPDELSFEVFSRDQSSYARLAVPYLAFRGATELACGTTNVDFSAHLHDLLDRLRSYRTTRFEIGPSGFATATRRDGRVDPTDDVVLDVVREKRIDLPSGWLAGFLQVHGLMSMRLACVRLAPVDVHDLVRFLATHHAKASPRAIRWDLRPKERVRIVIEPWGTKLDLSRDSVYDGAKEQTIRTWGRDRLRALSRLVPVSEHIDVFLAGTGLPSVWVAHLGGEATFTLALSGWTDNDWVEGEARFDLLTRRTMPSVDVLSRVYETLRAHRRARPEDLATELSIGVEDARSASSVLCQAGRAMVDLASGVHRHRDLLVEPFDAQKAIAAARAAETESDPKAKAAKGIFDAGAVRIIARRPVSTGFKVSGSARGAAGGRVRPQVHVDAGGQIIEASCTCAKGERHGITHGPCEHVLALRLAHMHELSPNS